MFLVAAFLLAFVWVIAFGVMHVTAIGIHTLIGLGAACVLAHFIHVRRYRAAPGALPPDAIK
jgi:hypothetical protein